MFNNNNNKQSRSGNISMMNVISKSVRNKSQSGIKQTLFLLPLFSSSSSLSLCTIIIMAHSIYGPFIHLCRENICFLFFSALFAFVFGFNLSVLLRFFLRKILWKKETRFFAQSGSVLQSTENCANYKSVTNISVTNQILYELDFCRKSHRPSKIKIKIYTQIFAINPFQLHTSTHMYTVYTYIHLLPAARTKLENGEPMLYCAMEQATKRISF